MKRSSRISLVMLTSISALAVSGCDDVPQSPPDPGGTFSNQAECVAVYDKDTCEAAEKLALAEHNQNAPKTTREQCIADYGADMCQPAPGGNGLFMPMMIGYMLGSMNSTPAPLYYGPGSYRERERGGSVPIYSSGYGYRGSVGSAPYRSAAYSGTRSTTKGSLNSSTSMTQPAQTQRGGFGTSFRADPKFQNSYRASNPTAFSQSSSSASSRSTGGSFKSSSSSSVSRGGFGSSARGFSAGG